MSVPDFRNPLYWNRSIKAAAGTLLFAPGGPFRGRQGGEWRHYLVSR